MDVIGFGSIGRELATRLVKKDRITSSKFKVISISDSTATIFPTDPKGILSAVEWKSKGKKLSEWRQGKNQKDSNVLEVIRSSGSAAVVDVTNSDYAKPLDSKKRVLSALGSGKHFVTANKVALSNYFTEIFDVAKRQGLKIGFSGTVLGARNAITIAQSLDRNEIQSATGVLNASTTMILSKLEEDVNLPFDLACKIAAEAGILESDWSIDLDGMDAAAKTAILANVLFPDMKTSIRQVARTGIRVPKARDLIERIRKKNSERGPGESFEKIRLVSDISRKKVLVEPRIVQDSSPLAVEGKFNTVSLVTRNFGEITVRNAGGGIALTASAILSDLRQAVS